MRAVVVRWGSSYLEHASLTGPQLEALKAVREAASKTAGSCFVSKKTETWFTHKTTVNAIAARALEKLGLVKVLFEVGYDGGMPSSKVRLTDYGVLALRGLDKPSATKTTAAAALKRTAAKKPAAKSRHVEPSATRTIDGVQFHSNGDGHWRSSDGRFAVMHLLQGTAEACWELVRLKSTAPGDWELLDSDSHFGVIVWRASREGTLRALELKEGAA